ncbi:hypothetical protein [Endozoicomonas sp. SESOKO3]|uniref:hypothetical protein n=1 Tax=Endozoicomonas sp. SESOKO3 TaxID=2828744 RepID=UPI0021483696|nr:hypothetical protein [Endozoicomonas sp. SESOKO3]
MNLLKVSCASLTLTLSVPAVIASTAAVSSTKGSSTSAPSASTVNSKSRYEFSCGASSGICGKQYCERDLGFPEVKPLYGESSVDSDSQYYNLASLLRGPNASNLKDFCVDQSVLNDPKAGYDVNELEGAAFWAVLKLELLATGQVFYVPLKTNRWWLQTGKSKSEEDEVVTYRMKILNVSPNHFDPYFTTQYGLAVRSWLLFRRQLRAYSTLYKRLKGTDYLQAHDALLSVRAYFMKSSDLKVSLTPDNYYRNGGVYDAVIYGALSLPDEDVVEELKLESRSTRFPTIGSDNFRLNQRNPKGVSFLPTAGSQVEGSAGRFRVIELVLMPKSK